MQIIGLYSIFDQIYFRRESIEKYSFLGMLCATIIDCMLLTVIISLCLKSWTRFSIYIFPATLGSMMIFAMEFRTLSLFQDDERPLRFYANIYGSILLGCTFAYFLNMRGFVFFSSSVIVMFPQIIHNYIVGHRMKVELNMYLFFALPRFSLIVRYVLCSPIYDCFRTIFSN